MTKIWPPSCPLPIRCRACPLGLVPCNRSLVWGWTMVEGHPLLWLWWGCWCHKQMASVDELHPSFCLPFVFNLSIFHPSEVQPPWASISALRSLRRWHRLRRNRVGGRSERGRGAGQEGSRDRGKQAQRMGFGEKLQTTGKGVVPPLSFRSWLWF